MTNKKTQRFTEKSGVKWWEKTVEYFYFAKYVNGIQSIFPFDGKEEKISDAALFLKGKWIIIEFKREIGCIDDEIQKFDNFPQARESLEDKDKHHFLVYGTFNNEFDLEAETYFSRETDVSVGNLFSKGISKKQFDEYLNLFLSYKKKSTSGEGKGETLNEDILDNPNWIIGVSGSSGNIKFLNLLDYKVISQYLFDKNAVEERKKTIDLLENKIEKQSGDNVKKFIASKIFGNLSPEETKKIIKKIQSKNNVSTDREPNI